MDVSKGAMFVVVAGASRHGNAELQGFRNCLTKAGPSS